MGDRAELSDVRPWGSLNWPNRISILRLLFVIPFVILLLNQERQPLVPYARYGALGIFLVMAASDFLDGVLARRLDARTRLGAILDPLADKALIICAAVILSLPGSAVPGARLANWVVVAIVGKDLWVIVGFLVLYLVTDRFVVRPTFAGKASTFGQLFMIGAILTAPDFNRLVPRLGTTLAAGTSWAVVGLCVLAVISYTRLGLRYVAREEKPLDNNGPARP